MSEEGLSYQEASKKVNSYETSLEMLGFIKKKVEEINTLILKNTSIEKIINSSQKYQFVKELFEEN